MQAAPVDRAIELFRQANARDPNRVLVDGELEPRQLVEAERTLAWVMRLDPQASDALRLAAHCQHLRRWEIPRNTFPQGRVGYLKWRKELSRFHARAASETLREAGVDEATIDAVRSINLKQGLLTSPDTQTIEDALCLTFLEHDFSEFASKHPETKVIEILRKTWHKMSSKAREAALALELGPEARALIERALETQESGEGSLRRDER